MDELIIERWSWGEMIANIGLIIKMAREIAKLDLSVEGALEDYVQAHAKELEALVVASLKNGKDDLAKINGLEEMVDVIVAVMEVNGVQAAIGKAKGLTF